METNWEFLHVGVIVKDMDKAVEYYQSLGIATFQPEHMFDSSLFTDWKIYGKTPDTTDKHKVRMVQIGPLTLELLQPVSGESIHNEFLDSQGEGAEHICFVVDDLDKETAKLVEKGIPVIVSAKRQSTSIYAYFDTRKGGNLITELVQRRK